MRKRGTPLLCIIFAFLLIVSFLPLAANDTNDNETNDNEAGKIPDMKEMETQITAILEEGRIPGASVILVKGNDFVAVKSYGYADLESQTAVTENTLFELGSCSKSFTALGILQLVKEGWVKLDDPISKYFPWFEVSYRGEPYKITINQLLHHTSGIPGQTFARIPQGDNPDALQAVV